MESNILKIKFSEEDKIGLDVMYLYPKNVPVAVMSKELKVFGEKNTAVLLVDREIWSYRWLDNLSYMPNYNRETIHRLVDLLNKHYMLIPCTQTDSIPALVNKYITLSNDTYSRLELNRGKYREWDGIRVIDVYLNGTSIMHGVSIQEYNDSGRYSNISKIPVVLDTLFDNISLALTK